jgi:hypothetical protein
MLLLMLRRALHVMGLRLLLLLLLRLRLRRGRHVRRHVWRHVLKGLGGK